MLEPRFKPRRLTPSMDGLYIDTDYGPIKVWADKNGIYIDLFDRVEGDICLASLHPEEYGMSSHIYENYGSVFPTKSGFFTDVDKAYSYLVVDDSFSYDRVLPQKKSYLNVGKRTSTKQITE